MLTRMYLAKSDANTNTDLNSGGLNGKRKTKTGFLAVWNQQSRLSTLFTTFISATNNK